MGLEWILKGHRKGEPTSTGNGVISPNTIDGLVGVDIVLSNTNLSLLVQKGDILLAQVVISEIVTWSIETQLITIITMDSLYLQLKFVSNSERNIAIATIESSINL